MSIRTSRGSGGEVHHPTIWVMNLGIGLGLRLEFGLGLALDC